MNIAYVNISCVGDISDDDLQNPSSDEEVSDVALSDEEAVDSDSSDEDDDIPLSNFATCNVNIEWPKNPIKWTQPADSKDIPEQRICINPAINKNKSLDRHSPPIDFFNLSVTEQLIKDIQFQTELYNTWRSVNKGSRKGKEVSIEEIRRALDIMLLTGIVKLPNRRMYWPTRNKCTFDNQLCSKNKTRHSSFSQRKKKKNQ